MTPPVPNENIILQAVAIAKRSLRGCYANEGVYAGLSHFKEYWARDGLWAVLGVLKIGDLSVAKKQIDLFIQSMDENGRIPLRIASEFGLFWKLLGLPHLGKIKPLYSLNPAYFWFSGKNGRFHYSKDGGSLLVIASLAYFERTRDHQQLKEWWPKLTKAMTWYEERITDGLIDEDWHEGWMDTLRLKGATIYTNVLYLKALVDMGKMASILGKNVTTWQRLAKQTKTSLVKNFFNGSYFNHLGRRPQEKQSFVVDGNMLAVWWKMVSPKKARLIINHFLKSKVYLPVPCRVNTPRFHDRMIPNRFKLIGLSGYHNDDCAWLWIGAVSVMALKKYFPDTARTLLEKMSRLIVKHDTVHEVYNLGGNPLKTWFYRSERSFAWSSALFLAAASEWYDKLIVER